MILFSITFIFLIFFSLNLILSSNTLYSILSLICIFVISSILLLLLGVDYIPLIFISIYVGALSILFLFVVMMLNSRILIKTNNFLFYFFLLFSLFIFFIFLVLFNFFNFQFVFDFVDPFINLSIKNNLLLIIGFLLFTKYFTYILLSAVILFIAMLGSVSLVLEPYKKVKSQIIYQQISRNCQNSYFKVF